MVSTVDNHGSVYGESQARRPYHSTVSGCALGFPPQSQSVCSGFWASTCRGPVGEPDLRGSLGGVSPSLPRSLTVASSFAPNFRTSITPAFTSTRRLLLPVRAALYRNSKPRSMPHSQAGTKVELAQQVMWSRSVPPPKIGQS